MDPASRNAALMRFGTTLPILQRGYRAAVDRAVAHIGLSHAIGGPLVMLGRMGAQGDTVRQSALADVLGIEAPSLARSLDQLVAAGLAERRDDPDDRRAKSLHLTASGHAARDKAETALRDMRAGLFDGVSDRDLATCLRVFKTLGARLGSDVPQIPDGPAKA
jgi:MarR family transcriptional regulator for hemolysin